MSARDRADFEPVLRVWRPEDRPPVFIVRWFATEWCNYGCAYCPQTHGRFEPKGEGFTAHAFDNHPLERWQDAFVRHFGGRRLSMTLTGGEPMLDRRHMLPMLRTLTSLPSLESLRIDTNASWAPESYADLDKSRIHLMCTLHPSQVKPDSFFEKIDRLLAGGFRIGMVNYVMSPENFDSYADYKERLLERGIPLQPNPLWDSAGLYSAGELEFLQRELPEIDFQYRTKIRSPYGRRCLYPAIAYELDNKGFICLGCHPATTASFFDAALPEPFAGPVPCPYESCVCLDKYSFLEGSNRNITTNPLDVYSRLLRERH